MLKFESRKDTRQRIYANIEERKTHEIWISFKCGCVTYDQQFKSELYESCTKTLDLSYVEKLTFGYFDSYFTQRVQQNNGICYFDIKDEIVPNENSNIWTIMFMSQNTQLLYRKTNILSMELKKAKQIIKISNFEF